MSTWKLKVHLIAEEFFQYSLITYLVLLLAETIKEGFVSFFFNLNILLVVVLVSGVAMVLTHHEKLEEIEREKGHKITGKDVEYIAYMALGGAALVYFKTQELGTIAYVIAALTTIIIILLSVLLITDKN